MQEGFYQIFFPNKLNTLGGEGVLCCYNHAIKVLTILLGQAPHENSLDIAAKQTKVAHVLPRIWNKQKN